MSEFDLRAYFGINHGKPLSTLQVLRIGAAYFFHEARNSPEGTDIASGIKRLINELELADRNRIYRSIKKMVPRIGFSHHQIYSQRTD